MHLFVISALLATTGAPVLAGAAPSPASLDLRSAVAYALTHDPALLSRRAQVAQTEQTFVQAHAAEFPTISGGLSSQLSRSQNSEGSLAQYGLSPGSRFSQNTAQVTSVYNFSLGALPELQAQRAKRNVESARADLQRAQEIKAIDVAANFYGLATRRESIRLAAADVAFQRTLLATARVNERVGRVAGVDVLRAQASTARSEATLLSVQSEAANAQETLAQSIGAPLDVVFAVPAVLGEPPVPRGPIEALVELAETARPDVLSARAALSAAILTDRTVDFDRYPQIAINGGFGNTFSPTNYGNTAASLAARGLPPPPRGNPGFWQIGAQATLSSPLVDYGTHRAGHRAAREQIDAATAALDSAKRAIELDVRQSLRNAQSTFGSLQYSKSAASLARESARIAQLQYRNGLISFTDAGSAQQQALASENDLAAARANYLIALTRLRVALATTDPVSAMDVQ